MKHRLAFSWSLVSALAFAFISSALTSAQESTSTAQEVVVTPTMVTTINELPTLPAIIGLARWTYEPDATMRIELPGPEVYVVESGRLVITVDGPVDVVRAVQSATPIADNESTSERQIVLGRGDQMSIMPQTAHTITNESDRRAIVLNLVSFPASLAVPSWLPDPDLPTGISLQNIASTVVNEGSDVAPGEIRITVSRAELPIGSSLPIPEGEAGFAAVVSGTMGWQTETQSGTYRAPDVAFLTSGESATATNAGSQTLVVQIMIVQSVI